MPETVPPFRLAGSARSMIRALRPRQGNGGLSREQIVTALYRALLGREPDPEGLAIYVEHLVSERAMEVGLRGLLVSAEFRSRMLGALLPVAELPDLTRSMPGRYQQASINGASMVVYRAEADDDVALMQSLIQQHRYYDRFDVWSPIIDLDKEVTAAIAVGLGA